LNLGSGATGSASAVLDFTEPNDTGRASGTQFPSRHAALERSYSTVENFQATPFY
jgi:hypothetical protein